MSRMNICFTIVGLLLGIVIADVVISYDCIDDGEFKTMTHGTIYCEPD